MREICEHVVKDKAQSSCTDCHQLHTVRAEAKSEDMNVSARAIFMFAGREGEGGDISIAFQHNYMLFARSVSLYSCKIHISCR